MTGFARIADELKAWLGFAAYFAAYIPTSFVIVWLVMLWEFVEIHVELWQIRRREK